MTLRISDIGECELIKLLNAVLPPCSPTVEVGVGDDCCVVSDTCPGWSRRVMTIDMMAEGTHFPAADDCDLYKVGCKAMASNISDIAAMGGKPLYALLGLAAPPSSKVSHVLDLYRGIADEAAEFGVSVVGGDTIGLSAAGQGMTISVTLTGLCRDDVPLPLRSNARSGQNVFVTGRLGGSRAGLLLLTDSALHEKVTDATLREQLIDRHMMPKARVAAGMAVAAHFPDSAMIDISDSLMNEMTLICKASNCYADLSIEDIPLYPGLDTIVADGVAFALFSGEEYELLFCTAADIDEVRRVFDAAGAQDLPVTCIGRIVVNDGTRTVPVKLLDVNGLPTERTNETFSHF